MNTGVRGLLEDPGTERASLCPTHGIEILLEWLGVVWNNHAQPTRIVTASERSLRAKQSPNAAVEIASVATLLRNDMVGLTGGGDSGILFRA